jgi:predicted N-acetyltransferase YhbS
MSDMTKSSVENECPMEIRTIAIGEAPLIGELHAEVFGPGRFARTAYRIREGIAGPSQHCRALWRGDQLAGSVTLTEIVIGEDWGHWLLGPLAVRPDDANKGFGRQLVVAALQSVAQHGRDGATTILVGDLAYYERFGFEQVPPGQVNLPGPFDSARLLIWRGPDGACEMPAGLVHAANH